MNNNFWIWFWSFISGMGLLTSVTTYKLGEPILALTNFGLTLATSLIACKHMSVSNDETR